jgi:glutaredoxin
MIIIYSKDKCTNCDSAKAFCVTHNLSYIEKKITADELANGNTTVTKEHLLEIAPMARTVPVILVDEQIFYSVDKFKNFITTTCL